MDPSAFPEALAAARRGDERAFGEIWRQFQPPLLRYLRGSGGAQLAEDVAAQTWLEVVRTLDRFEGDERGFRAWLFTIARHRLIDVRRELRRKPETVVADPADAPAPQPGPEEVAEQGWSTAEGLALIGMLAPDQAEVVLLRVVGELSTSEVAAIVGKREGAVRVLAHRGLKRLAQVAATQGSPSAGVTR